MAQIWLEQFSKAIGMFFLHPVIYFSITLVLVAGYLRVKREREDFNIRVNHVFHELKLLLPAGLLAGVIVSVITLGIGMTLPFEVIVLIAITTIVLGILGNARLLTPALTAGVPILLICIAYLVNAQGPLINGATGKIDFLRVTPFLLSLLIVTEGMLILKNGLKDCSPKLRKSRRGLTVGAHQVKRHWLLPIFFFLPTGVLTAPFEWWPVIHWGTETYSLILVPYLIGFQHQVQSSLPKEAVGKLGRQVVALGIILLAGSIAVFLYPTWTPPIIAAVAIFGRLWISYRHRVRENKTPYYYTARNIGVMVLDVIPGTPAHKMKLKTGEIIRTCNQIAITNKQELYGAILKNRAYCKLEIIDTNGEIRLVQGALYEGDHHELGILFIEKQRKRKAVEAI